VRPRAIIREAPVAAEDVGDQAPVRTVTIHFAAPVSGRSWRSGVRDVHVQGDVLEITVAGSLDAVVKLAARHEVVDLVSHEPSLEDVFLTYYETERPDGE
jgi:ABC-2 type transport system ATP-binding protein